MILISLALILVHILLVFALLKILGLQAFNTILDRIKELAKKAKMFFINFFV